MNKGGQGLRGGKDKKRREMSCLLIFSLSCLPGKVEEEERRARVASKPRGGDNQERGGAGSPQEVPAGTDPSQVRGPQGIPGPRRFPAGDMN